MSLFFSTPGSISFPSLLNEFLSLFSMTLLSFIINMQFSNIKNYILLNFETRKSLFFSLFYNIFDIQSILSLHFIIYLLIFSIKSALLSKYIFQSILNDNIISKALFNLFSDIF